MYASMQAGTLRSENLKIHYTATALTDTSFSFSYFWPFRNVFGFLLRKKMVSSYYSKITLMVVRIVVYCLPTTTTTVLGFCLFNSWRRQARFFVKRQSFGAMLDMSKGVHETKPGKCPPYLAIITELTACDTPGDVNTTVRVIQEAISTDLVDWIIIRVRKPTLDNTSSMDTLRMHDFSREFFDERTVLVQDLIHRIRQLPRSDIRPFQIAVSSDWISAVDLSTMVDVGIHLKESHRHLLLPLLYQNNKYPFYGTSAHSLASAYDAVTSSGGYPPPKYILVGTCYATESHPEKDSTQLEGPALPGQVAHALRQKQCQNPDDSSMVRLSGQTWLRSAPTPTVVLAIGGIDETNCRETIQYGADGVAVIRAVMRADDPAEAVRNINRHMLS
jgi:thiamine monophosphate synthase